MRQSLAERLWSRISVLGPDECWEWQGTRYAAEYGKIQVGDKTCIASRVVYELTKGPIPQGKFVCHSCDNPPCCNPKHLWPGTTRENALDAKRKNRLARGERIASSERTSEEVLQIMEMAKQGIGNAAIAKVIGCSEDNVGFIVTGKSWVHLTGGAVRAVKAVRKLTEDQVRVIKSMPFEIITQRDVAELLGVSLSQINRIVLGQRWAHIPCASA